MTEIAEEMQKVADNADKCINYPIGEKLDEFFRQGAATNFVLSGVIIYSAARIYGRKVDYLEQEIIGMAKNFEDVGVGNEESSEKKNTEAKKSRTKKFIIRDSVNIKKLSFDEKPVTESSQNEINKSLDIPCRINLLQKMKEYFSSKNRAKTGKTIIPKRLLFTSDCVTPNFGASQIYDFDDQKEIIGSRKDFTCFSYYINNYTGELQNEVNYSLQIRIEDDSAMQTDINLDHVFSPNFSRPETPNDRMQSPSDWLSPPRSPCSNIRESFEREIMIDKEDAKGNDHDLSHLNLDEGIEIEEYDRNNTLLPESPTSLLRIFNFEPTTATSSSPKDLKIPEVEELSPPTNKTITVEARISNFLMIPLKKLKHKCAFDLPNEEYGELKKMRKQHDKSIDYSVMKQTRIFNPFEMMREANFDICNRICEDKKDDEDEDFLGFTKEQQNEASTFFNNHPPTDTSKNESNNEPFDSMLQTDISRKNSNDSGFDENCSAEMSSLTSPDQSTSHRDSIDLDETKGNDVDISTSKRDELDGDSDAQINGGDSCYNSLASGESSKTELSSFFMDLENRNKLIDEREELEHQIDEETLKQSEERVLMMQQSAVNIAKWKDHLKPILIGSEMRSKVDIKECASQMIGKIGNVNDTKTFSEVTEVEKTPILFLTMLQLINNRNIEITHPERSMKEPLSIDDIKLTLKSKVLHQEKFNELGQQFEQAEEQKKTAVNSLKRKIAQTSTPAKRVSLGANESSIHFNDSQSILENDSNIFSQSSSGYFSQSSYMSDL